MTKSQNPTILIIDDDAEIRYSLDRVLSPDGHKIITADSGEQGIEVAEKNNPDLIFLDNRMGGISGIETLQHSHSFSGITSHSNDSLWNHPDCHSGDETRCIRLCAQAI